MKRTIILAVAALACVLEGAVAFSIADHVSFWLACYWALGTATTAGSDVALRSAAARGVAAAVMLTCIPLLGATFASLTALHVHRHIRDHVDRALAARPAEDDPERTATMTASAQGIDISAYQPVYTAEQLADWSFAFFRATDGLTEIDGAFAGNWANARTAGIHRGAYMELEPESDATAAEQAAVFIATVKAQRVEPGDMFAVVASDYTGVTDAEVKAALDAIASAFPHGPVFIYSDESEVGNWSECTAYPLWEAAYSDTPPANTGAWSRWTIWQYQGAVAPDCDAYNGTAAQLQAWLNSIAYPTPAKPPARPAFGPPQNLTVRPGDGSVLVERCDPPAAAPAPVDHYEVSVFTGSYPSEGTQVQSYPRYMKAAPEQFGSLQGIPSGTHMTLRATAYTADGQASAYADVSFQMP